jgi:hypothetical protein
MDKIYQPVVIEKTNELISYLEEINFFSDNEINKNDFSVNYFNDVFTERFINGTIDELFTEEEFEKHLHLVMVGSVLSELKTKGYINSYEDETTEETFFITKEGKEYMKNNYTDDESL